MDLHALVRQWAIPEPYTFRTTEIGYMNLTHIVDTPAGRFVLRIYQATADLERIRHEHALTARLRDAGLSFAVPAPVPARSGDTLVPAGESHAVLIPFLPGTHPDLEVSRTAHTCGAALAELALALGRLPAGEGQPFYRDLTRAHHLVPDPVRALDSLPFEPETRRRLADLFTALQAEAPAAYAQLPQQVIHGDPTPGNLLTDGGRVTAVLDFEFSSTDIRAMDLAVALGGGPRGLWEDGGWAAIESYGRGYFSRLRLSEAEIRALPLLIRLRRWNMLIQFAARYFQGLDSERWMQGIGHWTLEADDWLNENAGELIDRALRW